MRLSRIPLRLRFRLLTLLVVMTLLALGAAWLGHRHMVARRHFAAVAAISGEGIYLDYEQVYQTIDMAEPVKPAYPAWLIRLIGTKHTYGGARVTLFDQGATDDNLLALAELDHLLSVELTPLSVKLSDASFRAFRRMPAVEHLQLTGTGAGRAGLLEIRHLRNLKTLYLFGEANVDDALIAQLVPELPKLESLSISPGAHGRVRLTDRGVRSLAQLPALKSVILDRCDVTDAGIAPLCQGPPLQSISLYDTQVTSQGVRALREAGVPEIYVVNDSDTAESGEATAQPSDD